MAQRKHQL